LLALACQAIECHNKFAMMRLVTKLVTKPVTKLVTKRLAIRLNPQFKLPQHAHCFSARA
jgi:hypothetical protein